VVIACITAISMPLGLVWLPLLVAWCREDVRQWFDPPQRQAF